MGLMLIAVLGSLESWYLKDITRAAVKRGHSVIGIPFRQLHGMVAQAISDVQAPVDSDAIRDFAVLLPAGILMAGKYQYHRPCYHPVGRMKCSR